MNRINAFSSFFLFSIACGNLPEGWEDAQPIDDFTQAECAGDPYLDEVEGVPVENNVEPITFSVEGNRLDIQYNQAIFRCEQTVEGFQMMDGDSISVLIQPQDMSPSQVAKCDCFYDIEISIGEISSGEYDVEVFHRNDEYGGESEVQRVGGFNVGIE